jgi:hypothetical protein
MLHADCSTRLAEHQLPIVDRMAMAHSSGVRPRSNSPSAWSVGSDSR